MRGIVCRKRLRSSGLVDDRWALGLDRHEQSITAARNRLDESRRIRGIVQSLTQSAYSRVQAMIEVDERSVGPQPAPELFAADHLAGPFEQGVEQGKGLIRQAVCAAFAPQVS
jgi:hypothetical protein